uniref:Uncharacterized protein n=1 Tax=Aegilops tauschii subsp. strangulata TaxID=200361 RepID=A0A453LTS1_AEGTS
ATLWLTLKTGSSLHQHRSVALHSLLLGPACSSDCIVFYRVKTMSTLHKALYQSLY